MKTETGIFFTVYNGFTVIPVMGGKVVERPFGGLKMTISRSNIKMLSLNCAILSLNCIILSLNCIILSLNFTILKLNSAMQSLNDEIQTLAKRITTLCFARQMSLA